VDGGFGEGALPQPTFFSLLWSQNAYFGTFSGLFEHCNTSRSRLQTSSTPAHSDIPGWLWLNQRRWRALNIIFSVGEYMTNLIIVNVKTLSHDDSNSHNFYSDGLQFGGMAPNWPLWIRYCLTVVSCCNMFTIWCEIVSWSRRSWRDWHWSAWQIHQRTIATIVRTTSLISINLHNKN